MAEKNKMVVYINSERMGSGSDELGLKLMSNFLSTLTDFVNEISHITLVNAGVKLACRDSAVIDNLKQLEGAGVQILSCVTCLNHFDLKEKLVAGSVSNMYTILDTVTKSSKVLTP